MENIKIKAVCPDLELFVTYADPEPKIEFKNFLSGSGARSGSLIQNKFVSRRIWIKEKMYARIWIWIRKDEKPFCCIIKEH